MFKNIFTEQVGQRVFGFVMSLTMAGAIAGFIHVGLTLFSVENPTMTFLLPSVTLTLAIFAIVWNKKWQID